MGLCSIDIVRKIAIIVNINTIIGVIKFVIPSVLSFALSGVYAIVDGLFVGHSVGNGHRYGRRSALFHT